VPITPRRFSFLPSHPVEDLLLESRDSADHASRSSQRSRESLACLDRGAERPATHLGAERLEEWVTRLGHAAGDHGDVGIEDVQQVRDAAMKFTAAHDLSRDVIVFAAS
jgi:hypothetical protein